MKKLFITLTAIAMICVAPTAFASAKSYIGDNVANLNINVRSQPKVGDNLIDHYLKGQTVTVTKQMADWCKVQFKNYSKAYVYCPNLNATGVENIENWAATPVAPATQNAVYSGPKVLKNEAAVDAIRQMNTWLQVRNRGINNINTSYDSALAQAKTWDAGAKLYDVQVYKPTRGSTGCTFRFVSAKKVGLAYQAKCKSLKTDQMYVEEVKMPQLDTAAIINAASFDSTQLPLRSFITKILGPTGATNEIREYFDGSSYRSITVSLGVKTPADAKESALYWDAFIFGKNNGKRMHIYENAQTLDDTLHIQTT